MRSRKNSRVARRKKMTMKWIKTGGKSAKSSRSARKRVVRRKKRSIKGRRTRVRRGNGVGCSREREQVDPVRAEPMPDDLPLPPGARRIQAMDLHAELPSAVASPPSLLTGEPVNTDTPAINGYTPRAINLDKHPSSKLVKSIMNFPDYMVLRVSPHRRQIEDAMLKYVYHPNYYDTFGADPRNVDDQLWRLVMGWYSEEGSSPLAVNRLLSALRSPQGDEIGF